MDVMDAGKWGRRALGLALVLILVLGLSSTLLQVSQRASNAAQARSDKVAACRSELRSTYVDTPTAEVQALESRLIQIQAAALEAVSAESGLSAEVPAPAPSTPYDGLSIAELYPLSAETRAELADKQARKDAKIETYGELARLSKSDVNEFLDECERLTS